MGDGSAERASRAVREAAGEISDPARPGFHFRPPAGWMNDPNGPIYRDGRYHLFYQHNPYGDVWGDIHWGHAWSPDLVRWNHLPVALAPSRDLGEQHCFTGSAWENDRAGTMLFYTSVPADTAARPCEQWAVRCGPGLASFRRHEDNPLLVPGDPPAAAFRADWRDPFVFEAAGRTFMILGAVLEEGGSRVLGGESRMAGEGDRVIPLYEAEDPSLGRWRYRGLLGCFPEAAVTFPECPNLFPVDDRWLLTYAAHEPVHAALGHFRPLEGSFREEERGRLDRTTFFYAAARYARAPGDAPVVVGWIRGWDGGRGWNGALSLPRVVEVGSDGALRQRPLPGLRRLRRRGARLERGAPGSDPESVPGLRSSTLEARAQLAGGEDDPLDGVSGLRLVDGGRRVASVRWLPSEGVVEVAGLRFPEPGREPGPPAPAGAPARWESTLVPVDESARGAVEVHLFWDRSVLEVFIGGGREVCTLVLDTRGQPVELEAFAEGGARRPSVRAWPLEEIW